MARKGRGVSFQVSICGAPGSKTPPLQTDQPHGKLWLFQGVHLRGTAKSVRACGLGPSTPFAWCYHIRRCSDAASRRTHLSYLLPWGYSTTTPKKPRPLTRVHWHMSPLTIARLSIAQSSFLQDSLADEAFVRKGLAGPRARLETSPAVLGAVSP